MKEKMDKATIGIMGMHCASCAMIIEGGLKKTEGVKSAAVNFATSRATIEFTPNKSGIVPWSCGMGMLREALR